MKFRNRMLFVGAFLIIVLVGLTLVLNANKSKTAAQQQAPQHVDRSALHQKPEPQNVENTNKQQETTKIDLKDKKFEQTYSGAQIIKKTDFQGDKSRYAIVELTNPQANLNSLFELYNYDTGTRENLPVNAKVLSFTVINENAITFICTGSVIRNTSYGFPYRLEFNRVREETAKQENHFTVRMEDYFLSVEEKALFGSGSSRDILDINLTYTGLQVLFDDALYAGAPTVPLTNISYDDKAQQMIINIEKAGVSINYEKERTISGGYCPYIKSVSFVENNGGCKIIITLSSNSLMYNVDISAIASNINQSILPFFNLRFQKNTP